MARPFPWVPVVFLLRAWIAYAQGADSILLLNQASIAQVEAGPQGNLLVAQRVGATVSVSRYSPQGGLLQSFDRMLAAGAAAVVLKSDSQGAIYLGAGSSLVRLEDAWIPQFPSLNFTIDAIGFDANDNPVLAVTLFNPPSSDGRLWKLDRATGQVLADLDIGSSAMPNALAVDSSGAVSVAGTGSSPTGIQGFAARFDAALQQRLYFTWLDPAAPRGIAVDSAGYAYIAETPLEVPVTVGPPGGGLIRFGSNTVHKLDPSGAIVVSNTGGGLAIALDPGGNPIAVGGAYPATGAFRTACGPRTDLGGLSVTLLDPATLQPRFSAFLPQQAFLGASAVQPDGSLFVATQSNRVLHVTPAAPSSPVACIGNGASYLVENSIVPGQLLTIFGRGLGADPISVYSESQQLPFASGGTEVRIGGYPAPLLAVSSGQINAVVPYEVTALGQAVIEISRNGTIIYSWQMNLAPRNPAPLLHFTLDLFQAPAWQDIFNIYPVPLADAWNQDGTRNSATNPAQPGSAVTIFATGFGPPAGNPPPDGAPGDPQSPPFTGIPVITPDGTLTGLAAPVPGRTNAVLGLAVAIPATFPGGPLPFVIGEPAAGAPVWTNFLYLAR